MPANDLDIYERDAASWWKPGSGLWQLHALNPPRFAFFDRHVPDWTNLRVLDIGCGGGFTSEFVAKRGARVSGVDISANSIAVAAEHARAHGLDIDYRVAAAESLPYADHSFDVVVCVDVLEHVVDLREVHREVHRVLRPGGVFLFDTINRTWLSRVVYVWLLEYLVNEIPRGTHDWKLFIRPEELQDHLRAVGFETPQLRGFTIKGKRADGSLRVDFTGFFALAYIGHAQKPGGLP
jgi:2-polyprenyl-6-hydroxyphenyl methylase/3-demethylubiquinone-9 3-methyltransferase